MHPPRHALALAAAAAGALASSPSACAVGPRVDNVPRASRFRTDGSSVLVLRVGDGEADLVAGGASALFFDEVPTSARAAAPFAPLTTVPLPTKGTIGGLPLACTLSTGLLANFTWSPFDGNGFSASYCKNEVAFWGAVSPSLGGPTCDEQGEAPANPAWSSSWNADSVGLGHGDGTYPLWYFEREGLPQLSYDGRVVSMPCYAAPAGDALKRGSWFGAETLDDALSYDDKTVAALDAGGAVDTVTHLPGPAFFYGPLVPDAPQYVTSAVTVAPLAPFFVGGAADNGEGTMFIDDDAFFPTKAQNRVSNTPGYFDYGTLGLYGADASAAPLLFVSGPSMRNAAQHGEQHEALRGLSVATVGGVPRLPQPREGAPEESITFQQLPGFEYYIGHPFGFAFESPASVWLADAGPGAQGGPETCSTLGGPCPPAPPPDWDNVTEASVAGLWDKYSCTLQHWTSGGGLLDGPWTRASSIVVSADAPCFSLAGRSEGDSFVLYTTTPAGGAGAPSTLWQINAQTGAVVGLAAAPSGQAFRGAALPPVFRANYTCPPGFFGNSCDRGCAFDCCAPCTIACSAGFQLVEKCSLEEDNACVPASATPSQTPPPTPSPTRSPSRSPTASRSPVFAAPPRPPAAAGSLGAGVGIGVAATLGAVGAAGAWLYWRGVIRVGAYAPLGGGGVAALGETRSLLGARAGTGADAALRRLGAVGGAAAPKVGGGGM